MSDLSPTTFTKRLHISNLNSSPSLSPSDLITLLSHYGLVKKVEGFGKLDGVGGVRKFGFVEVEITDKGLRRCLSMLNGTMYKGAKLRIGEAKPDYFERFLNEKQSAAPSPSSKKARFHHSKFSGIQSPDMTLVTRENAAHRPGWKVMSSGRVVRTMRMRPGKPLPPMPARVAKGKRVLEDVDERNDVNERQEKRRKRKKINTPDSRARVKTVDVTKWDGAYVTGVFLTGDDHDEKENVVDTELDVESPFPLPTSTTSTTTPTLDLSTEKSHTLSFINSFLFSTKPASSSLASQTADWDSDVDLDETNVVVDAVRGGVDSEEGYEIVPKEVDDGEKDAVDVMDVDDDEVEGKVDEAVDENDNVDESDGSDGSDASNGNEVALAVNERCTTPTPSVPQTQNETDANSRRTKKTTFDTLKDLFAPREDEFQGGFSLLNHLDINDYDNDGLVPFSTNPEPALVGVQQARVQIQPTSHQTTQPFLLDRKKPFFFPLPSTLSFTSPSSPFYILPTSLTIQSRWETNKSELTRGWKKRWREAGKVGRRRGMGEEE
ncbi:hypothetical protein J3R30DRAFT_3707906 [Lentinula aciculospora]|uniref:RRM domain-containing protein n=1 Tax=Lentinula aciculospora TaxID=153920 RepID=A0A9W9A3V9_9AGAR|nr:hypothetical protein J3R30DRAFT_3707906 [Lentinula aciculospora]